MLRSLKSILGYELFAQDGPVGRCNDFLFDDEDWVVRYMVADTGKWLPGRKVLVSPIALQEPDWNTRRLKINLTREQVESSPPLSDDEPVSKQFEDNYYTHYGWSHYWGGPSLWGSSAIPAELRSLKQSSGHQQVERGDPNLRSFREVRGYHIAATDHEIGHIEDLIVADQDWSIRYVVVNTRNWLPGRDVLVAPMWFRKTDWAQQKLHTDLSSEEIKDSPEYNVGSPINREYETRLYDYYGRPVYWEKTS